VRELADIGGAALGRGDLAVYAVVVLAAGLHACWNFLAKAMKDQFVAFWLINLTAALLGGLLLVFGRPARPSWPYLISSIVIHIGYNAGLLASYRHGELGQTYPLARGVAPLLVALGAWAIGGEALSAGQICGLVVIALGLTSLVWSRGRASLADRRAVGAALATGLTIAAYSVIDGFGVRRAGSPVGYAGVLFLAEGSLVLIGLSIAKRQPLPGRPERAWLAGAFGGVLSVSAYLLVLWAQTRADLAIVSALRETSVIVGALLGAFVLHEGDTRRRVLAAIVVFAGTALLVAA
jgi:drug/metabolite transporter (DMT)-like permease